MKSNLESIHAGVAIGAWLMAFVALVLGLCEFRLHRSFVQAVEDYHACEEGGLVCQIERHGLSYEVIGVDEDIYYKKGE